MFPPRGPPARKNFHFFGKKCLAGLDDEFRLDTLSTLPEAGPDLVGVVLRLFWDCKLELNFVPVYDAIALWGRRRPNRPEIRLGFFVG